MTESSTNMSADWIERVWKDNPCVLLENGNVRTGPVRLSFPSLFERSKPIPPATEGKYAATLLFPLGADIQALKDAASGAALEKWPNPPANLHSPFRDQGEKAQFDGYEQGGVFVTATADKQRPPVVDQKLAPIVDHDKVYPGVWAIVTLRPFTFDKGLKKGVSFGLQSVMIVADDKNLGGGGSNPSKDFAGVNIDQTVNPASLF